MVYKVIGLMSGSSLDGMDIAYVHLEEVRGRWSFNLLHAECLPYPEEWSVQLKQAVQLPVPAFLDLHSAYGRYMGMQVQSFIEKYQLHHKVDFIASHGHTVHHNPDKQSSFQLGDGAALMAVCKLPVINDLRAVDVAMGGQGAPIVPIGDTLLYADYACLVNLGGICNATFKLKNNATLAYDIAPANQVLNYYTRKLGRDYDEGGGIAATGKLLEDVLAQCAGAPYYQKAAPKSLDNATASRMLLPYVPENAAVPDVLHTLSIHIAQQIAGNITAHAADLQNNSVLLTGGGALNTFLVQQLQAALPHFTIEVPAVEQIQYKEAIVMALIAALRWREEPNVLASVTGAGADSIGGALWMC